MNYRFYIVLFMYTILAGNLRAQASDSLTIEINGINLSEDMSTLSSRNDELLVLLYDYHDTTKLGKPVLSHFFVLDSAQRKMKTRFAVSSPDHPFLLILIEQDTERTPEQLEPIVRKHFNQIIPLFKNRDRIGLEKITGHDDVMGIRVLPNLSGKKTFGFSGRYKLDKFSYSISID